MAMQVVFLFSDTVEGNIAYGNTEMTFDEVRACSKAADADGFINRMEDGYDTLIGERGVGLSGGQRQRISLARALAMKPSILVLDDTTSAVDMVTEAKIRDGLAECLPDTTKIIIAQRISSVLHADKIVVLSDGRIDAIGDHWTLMETSKIYRDVYQSQQEGAGL